MNIKLSDNQLKNIAAGDQGQYWGRVTEINDKEAVITYSILAPADSYNIIVQDPTGLTLNESVYFDIENGIPTNIQNSD